MLPRYHIFWGAIFTLIIWFSAQQLHPFYLLLIFLSTFLIDFDHYMIHVRKHKNLSLPKALAYMKKIRDEQLISHKKGKRERGMFFIFHTIEFHILIAFLGLFWIGFFYVFMGMVFHSLLDLMWLLNKDIFYKREYFFFNWARKKLF